MRLTTRSMIAGAAASLVCLFAVAGAANAGSGVDSDEGINLGDDGLSLRIFELDDPNDDDNIGQVDGLIGDSKLVGIDFRVQDKQFYGVGNQGGIYTIDTKDADVIKVSQLTVALSGTQFGVDFNPAADRLRVISDNGQNLRHNVNPGGTTLTDGALNYVVGTPVNGLTAAGYTNNDLSATTATTLFDIDTNLNQVAIQAPANAGNLSATGLLSIDPTAVAGFDIQSKTKSGVTTSNTGYAVLRTSDTGRPVFYKVDLLTGALSKVKTFDHQIADIAVQQR